jgi:hypothetical protein
MLPVGHGVGKSDVSRRIHVHYINLVVDPLNEELMQSRSNAIVGRNPIVAKNITIVTLHLDNEERGSERFAPHGELHGDGTSGLHRVAPHAIRHQVGIHELIILPSKLLEHNVRY